MGPGAFRLQGIGFLTPQIGWTGDEYLFRSDDGGHTFTADGPVPGFNRFHRVNDHLAFAGAMGIYRYDDNTAGVASFPRHARAGHHGLAQSRQRPRCRGSPPAPTLPGPCGSCATAPGNCSNASTTAGRRQAACTWPPTRAMLPGTYHFVLFTSWGPATPWW